jgi:hypothetical protein
MRAAYCVYLTPLLITELRLYEWQSGVIKIGVYRLTLSRQKISFLKTTTKNEKASRGHTGPRFRISDLSAVHGSLGSARCEVVICRVRCPGDVTAARQVTDG